MLNIDNKRKILKYLIIIVTIICIVCLTILVALNKERLNKEKIEKNEIQELEQIEYENVITEQEEQDTSRKLRYTDNRTNYFTVRGLVQNFINESAYRNTDKIMSMLSNDYINEYKVTEDNVFSNIDISPIKNNKIYLVYNTDTILESEQENYILSYLVSIKYRMSNSEQYINTKVLVIIDKQELKYEIYPYKYILDNHLESLKAGEKLELKISSLPEDAQKFSYQEKSNIELANELFEDWKEKIVYDKKDAYSKLNNQYKEKRFSNYNSFTDYLSNKKYIPTINQYRVYSKDDYTDYICTDQYNNYYIFKVQGGVMRYTVFLDNYTVELESFKENYDKSDDSGKIAIQTGKFKQMLNLKDYNAIYSKLNEKFKDNNFKTVSDLKKYLDEKIYNINTIEIQEITKKDDYYVCNGVIRNQQNQNEQKSIVIAIKLIGSNEFELSFSIK